MTRNLAASDRAIAHVRARAERSRETAKARIAEILARSGAGDSAVGVESETPPARPATPRVTLNFHPDRLLADGRTVAAALLDDGRYKSQFETGLSNGSRTAFAGGARDGWEEALFGSAYHEPVAAPSERPRYGALDVMHHADGGSPRFGSCYLALRRHMNARCTFTWGDSHLGPGVVGTADVFEPLLAMMLEAASAGREVLGVRMTAAEVVRRLSSIGMEGVVGRALDDYIEAQVHGPIELSSDVEALVMDPSFEETEVGSCLRELCERYGIPLRRHPGFVLTVGEAHAVALDFRGPRMGALAERIARAARRDRVDAATIGRAAESLARAPTAWQDWDTPDATLQHVKQLWHVLVRFGRPT